jgi:hypothetical protein
LDRNLHATIPVLISTSFKLASEEVFEDRILFCLRWSLEEIADLASVHKCIFPWSQTCFKTIPSSVQPHLNQLLPLTHRTKFDECQRRREDRCKSPLRSSRLSHDRSNFLVENNEPENAITTSLKCGRPTLPNSTDMVICAAGFRRLYWRMRRRKQAAKKAAAVSSGQR